MFNDKDTHSDWRVPVEETARGSRLGQEEPQNLKNLEILPTS